MNLKKFLNNSYTQISIYVIVVATIIMTIEGLIGNTSYLLGEIFEKIGWLLSASKPIILALVFTYLLDPIADFFEEAFKKNKWLKKKPKACRLYAVAVVCLIVVVVVSAIISILVYSITNQIKVVKFDDIVAVINQNVDNVNSMYKLVAEKIGEANIDSIEVKEFIQKAANYLLDWIKAFGLGIITSITGITSFVTDLFLALIMTIYLLIDGKLIKFHTKRILAAVCSDKLYKGIRSFYYDADKVFSGYIRGQGMDALCMMVLISVTLSICGVKFALIIGIFAGIGNLIPYVGPIVAYAGTVLVCLINGDFKLMVIAIIALIIIQLVDGNIIGPRLLSNAVEVHPLLVIVSLVFGGAVGGLLGMLLAVPVGALIKVLFMKFIDKRLKMKGMEINE